MTFDHVSGAKPHHQGKTCGSENVDVRRHACLITDTFEIGWQAALTVCLEAIVLLLLLRQSLNDSNGCKRFLGQGSQQPCARTGLATGSFDSMRVTADRPKSVRR